MAPGLNHSQQAARRLLLRIVVISSVAGGFYGLGVGMLINGEAHPLAVAQGVFCGAVISGWCASFDQLLSYSRVGRWLRGLNFARYITVKTVYYVIGIDGGIFLGEMLFAPLYGDAPWSPTDPVYIATFVIALAVSGAVNFMVEISRLLGPSVLRNFVTGRYHQPHEEERVFLFVDIIGSTQLAETLGNVEFHRLLNDFFTDLTEPILATRGEVHAYVGDQVIVTWPLAEGLKDARCLTCYRLMHDVMASEGNRYRARYGVAPEFRSALHAGPVVTGEMGAQKRQIVFLGDTVNTTSRLEQMARELNEQGVISAILLQQLSLPADVTAHPLGLRRLRGKDIEVELFGLRLNSQPTASEAA